MINCDLIIKGKYLLPMDDALRVINDGTVVISGSNIIAVGKQVDLAGKYKAKEVINAGNGIIMPGLINTHTHVAMTYFRGLADDLPLKEWLEEHIWPAEAKYMDENFVARSSTLACLEMLKSGTTALNNMSFFEEVIADVVIKSGIRAVLSEGMLKFPTPSCQTANETINKTIDLLKKFKDNCLIDVFFGPHSVYACEKKFLLKVKNLSDKRNIPIHIHVSETKKEVEDCQQEHGLTPVAYLDKLGLLGKNTIAAHSIWLGEDDIMIYKDRGVKVSHCPISNMKLASGVAPIAKMIKHGIIVGLGTDSAASNNTLDMFSEMRACALLHKVQNLDPTILPAREVVRMATVNGARVIGLDKNIGSLETGKKADIITINLDKPHLQPLYDPYSHLAHCVEAQDVSNVIINGRVVMKNRKVRTIDEEKVLSEAGLFKNSLNNHGFK